MLYTYYKRSEMEFFALSRSLDPGVTSVIEIGHGFLIDGRKTSNRARSFQLHIVVAGDGSFNSEPVEVGMGYLVAPGESYREVGGIEQFWINFSGEGVKTLLAEVGIDEHSHSFRLEPRSAKLIERELRALFSSEPELISTRLHMLGTLYRLLALFGSREPSEPESELPAIERVKRRIERSYSEPLSLPTLAAEVGLSPKYLSRRFKSETGLTVSEYLTRIRLSTAATLLLTDRRVDEIARAVGYGDPLYFSKAFSRFHGLSPSRWRSAERDKSE